MPKPGKTPSVDPRTLSPLDLAKILSTNDPDALCWGYPRAYVVMLGGDHNAARFLQRLIFFMPKARNPEGWVYKTDAEWGEDLLLGRKALRNAVAVLERVGVIQKSRRKVAGYTGPVNHYRIVPVLLLGGLEHVGDCSLSAQTVCSLSAQTKYVPKGNKPSLVSSCTTAETLSDNGNGAAVTQAAPSPSSHFVDSVREGEGVWDQAFKGLEYHLPGEPSYVPMKDRMKVTTVPSPTPKAPKATHPNYHEVYAAVVDLFTVNAETYGYGKLGTQVKRLAQAGADAQQVAGFKKWYETVRCKGLKLSFVSQMLEHWGAYQAYLANPRASSGKPEQEYFDLGTLED